MSDVYGDHDAGVVGAMSAERAGGGSFDVNEDNLESVVKRLDHAVFNWYRSLIAQGAELQKLPLKHSRVKVGSLMNLNVDNIDDKAVLYFNSYNLGYGDAGNPIHSNRQVRVEKGQNLGLLWISNEGAHRWGFRMDVRPNGEGDPMFWDARGSDDGWRGVGRLFFFGFEGF